MGDDRKSLVAGVLQLLVGLPLLVWGDLDTPVIALNKVGVVLIVLGLLELVVTGAWMAWKATRIDRRAASGQPRPRSR
jgi:Family of unknown function (DUF5708)